MLHEMIAIIVTKIDTIPYHRTQSLYKYLQTGKINTKPFVTYFFFLVANIIERKGIINSTISLCQEVTHKMVP